MPRSFRSLLLGVPLGVCVVCFYFIYNAERPLQLWVWLKGPARWLQCVRWLWPTQFPSGKVMVSGHSSCPQNTARGPCPLSCGQMAL